MDIQVGDKVRALRGGYHFVPTDEEVEVVELLGDRVYVVFTGIDTSGDYVESLRQLIYIEHVEKV